MPTTMVRNADGGASERPPEAVTWAAPDPARPTAEAFPCTGTPPGPGWWEGGDGRWYAPEQHPDYRPPSPAPPLDLPPSPSDAPPPPGWWRPPDGQWHSPEQYPVFAPLPPPAPSTATDFEGWRRDPSGVHEERWFTGGKPTLLVR